MRLVGAIFVIATLCPAPCFGMVSDVFSPVVIDGALQVDSRIGGDWDDESISRQRIHLDYGFSDQWAARLVLREQYTDEEHFEHQAVEAMVRLQLFEQRLDGFNGGFRLAYRQRDGDKAPNEWVVSWGYERRFAAWNFRHNVMLGWESGPDRQAGTEGEMRWQLLRPIPQAEEWALGGEVFNRFGWLGEGLAFEEQEHSAGLIARYQPHQRVRYQVGLLRGISDAAPDYAAKFFVNYRF